MPLSRTRSLLSNINGGHGGHGGGSGMIFNGVTSFVKLFFGFRENDFKIFRYRLRYGNILKWIFSIRD